MPLSGQLVLSDLGNGTPTPASYRAFDVIGGTDPARFNFRSFTPAIPAVEKALYYITGRYKIFGDGLQLYGDVMYAKTKQDNGLAPSPFTIPLGGYTNSAVLVPNFDPTLPALGPIDQANSTSRQRVIIQNSPFDPFTGRNGTTAPGSVQTLRYRLVQELGNRRSFFDRLLSIYRRSQWRF